MNFNQYIGTAAIIFALMIQTGAAFWWASAIDSRTAHLELVIVQQQIPSRIVKLEESDKQMVKSVDRIEKNLCRIEIKIDNHMLDNEDGDWINKLRGCN